MNKRARHFERIAEFKERFRQLPTETLRRRQASNLLYKEAAIALREVLEERELGDSEARGDSPAA